MSRPFSFVAVKLNDSSQNASLREWVKIFKSESFNQKDEMYCQTYVVFNLI